MKNKVKITDHVEGYELIEGIRGRIRAISASKIRKSRVIRKK